MGIISSMGSNVQLVAKSKSETEWTDEITSSQFQRCRNHFEVNSLQCWLYFEFHDYRVKVNYVTDKIKLCNLQSIVSVSLVSIMNCRLTYSFPINHSQQNNNQYIHVCDDVTKATWHHISMISSKRNGSASERIVRSPLDQLCWTGVVVCCRFQRPATRCLKSDGVVRFLLRLLSFLFAITWQWHS